MLTANFSEIIRVVKEKIEQNRIEEYSGAEIKSLCMMLWGYLRLIKSGFRTADDSTEASDEFFAYLKGMLDVLTKTQSKLMKKYHKSLMETIGLELDELSVKISEYGKGVLLSHEKQKKIASIISTIKSDSARLKVDLAKNLSDPYESFRQSIMPLYQVSTKITDAMQEMFHLNKNDEFLVYRDYMRKTFTSHLKLMTEWMEIESMNHQCASYVRNGDFIDLLVNS